jgi:truncated hemoglobin YjbI
VKQEDLNRESSERSVRRSQILGGPSRRRRNSMRCRHHARAPIEASGIGAWIPLMLTTVRDMTSPRFADT